MNKHKLRTPVRLLAIAALLCGVGLVAAQIQANAPRTPNDRATLQLRSTRVTQAEREAAADRLRALHAEALDEVPDPLGQPLAAKILVPRDGPPDYFETPNWANSPPLRKFVDTLPGLTAAGANNLGMYISIANPDTTTYPGSDYYEISVRQYTQQLHSDMPPTTLRGYVQTNLGTDASGQNTVEPAPILYLGPLIIAERDRPVRIKFTNELPMGADGDLFVPVDTTTMGAGMGPLGMDAMPMNFTQNRATLHLHGGRTPWISDGTPHQWITPNGEMTPYEKGVSLSNVPDMPDPGPGSQTFYWTNQQSARLMFWHDHAWGITRLNVYVGEAAGLLITDAVEQQLIADGIIPDVQIPLIIQDKTFVDPSTVLKTDPTWRWGTGPLGTDGFRVPQAGDLWYPHVYMTAQNPYDLTGANPFGRWMYGPWFWPPTLDILYPPIPNPYYGMSPGQPPEIPGVPEPSMPGESFLDTPLVNGTAYPALNLEPRPYRLRILNAANDRFWNLQLYEADPAVVTNDGRYNTEVRMVPAVASPTYPDFWPTDNREGGVPDPTTAGPRFIQIGTEGGFLPQPVVIEQQPIAWNADPTTFNFGNVSDHALLLAPAERADVIVDFTAFAGRTLILYNDAPAAFPASDVRNDYYTGAPNLTDTGGHSGPIAGYGPNTRTIMQINIAASPVGTPFNLGNLQAAFESAPGAPGVFERGQEPIIVGQTAYNTTYNTTFPSTWPLWGYSRIQDFAMQFKNVLGVTLGITFNQKSIHDEMGQGGAWDPEYGRMSGRLGVTLAAGQWVLQAYVDPPTEFSTECLSGPPTAGDGTQIWKITHNGVDTHPIHFHLFDVQVINRVGWDGAIRLPDANELGWKETVRVSPLEDTIVALRPIAPTTPFGLPESIRPMNPMEPLGSTMGFSQTDTTTGGALNPPLANELMNFGYEYVWHCHILSHEEMDMMRPVNFHVSTVLPTPPVLTGTDTGTEYILDWTDATPVGPDPAQPANLGNPANEVGFRVERDDGTDTFVPIATALANATTFTDATATLGTPQRYRVVAFNPSGDSPSNIVLLGSGDPPAAPTNLVGTLNGVQVDLVWVDVAENEMAYRVERAIGAGPFTAIATLPANSTTYSDNPAPDLATVQYRVYASNVIGQSPPSNIVAVAVPLLPPTNLVAAISPVAPLAVVLNWTDNSVSESGFTIQRARNAAFTQALTTFTAGTDATTYSDTTAAINTTYYYRVRTTVGAITSTWAAYVMIRPAVPTAPSNLTGTPSPVGSPPAVTLAWQDNATTEGGFDLQRATNTTFTQNVVTFNAAANTTSYDDNTVAAATRYYYRVRAFNGAGTSGWSNRVNVTTATPPPAAPTNLVFVSATRTRINISWTDVATNEQGYYVERAPDVNGQPGTFARIATLAANTNVYGNGNLTRNTRYWYQVQAYNVGGRSAYAGPLSAMTLP